jgi:dipeptidyl aminopeptidase/acylaminoacyl peptidase
VVIQPEFRGSTGFGDSWFQQNGFHSWRTAIGDVNDAGHWLVKQGMVDPAKLAIFGWSYGGYAALQANVLDADLFKAVVAVAPVTDIGLLRGQVNQNVEKKDIGEGTQIAEGSPDRHAQAFKAPVLMFHGTKDINVFVEESRAMDKALHDAGKSSQLVIYPGDDHQLRDSKVRADMLAKSDAFLAKALHL